MSLVDQYDTRDFVNGRVIGGNYNEMSGNTTYSDISPYGSNRMAGAGLGLDPDVVSYMAEAAQGARPQDASMDEAIAEGFLDALSGELVAGTHGFRGKEYGQINPRRGGLEYMTKQALESLPNSGLAEEKHRQIRGNIALPGFMKGV